jgi:hypothetical protein
MAGDRIGFAAAIAPERRCRRYIGPDIGSTLALGHAHANGDGLLLLPRREARIVASRDDLWQHAAQEHWLMAKREQVHVGKGRALVEHLLSLRNGIGGHGILYGV